MLFEMAPFFFVVFFCFGGRTEGFNVVWNAPTEMCHKYGFNFSQLGRNGIIQNSNDTFRGDRITILYDPGLFPAILSTGDRNGGVPQVGNLEQHLKKFANDLQSAIPNSDFDGIGVIDFEHWRPVWRENWGKYDVYRQRSREIEAKKNPGASKSTIEKKATYRFEKSAYVFIDSTLSLARKLRPKSRWGYYAFPYCFNFTPKNGYMKCSPETKEDNDRSYWMWKTGNALFPSAYIYEKSLPFGKRAKMIEGRTVESIRIARKKGSSIDVYVYVSYKYQDTSTFLSKVDMKSSLDVPKKAGAKGVVIWGSSKDVDTRQKCTKLDDYVNQVLLPAKGPANENDDWSSNDILGWFE